jgi:threonine/homoserine/homoserine lactone efflux protein
VTGSFLAFLGVSALIIVTPAGPAGPLACYRRGLLSDLGNPKMAVFFTSLLPQFGTGFAVLALLGMAFCAMTFLWLAGYAVALAKLGDLLQLCTINLTSP